MSAVLYCRNFRKLLFTGKLDSRYKAMCKRQSWQYTSVLACCYLAKYE